MIASRCCLERARWLLALILLGGATPALAASTAAAELTTLLDSGNLLRGPAPEAPPWQELASLRSGHERRARLTMATRDAGFLPNLTTLALLRLELGLDALAQGGAPVLRDASSFLGLGWHLAPSVELRLRVFPLDTDYVRLGYLHALDWGGTDVARNESVFLQQTGGAPGVELGVQASRVRLFSAAKWASVPDVLRGQRRLWGALAGASFELAAPLTVEAGFGYFQQPAPVSRRFVEGASLRVVWHRGLVEPELAAEPFRAPSLRDDAERLSAPSELGFALALEAVTLVGAGRRFEGANEQHLSAAPAFALYGSVRSGALAGHAAFTWRSLAFVLRNDPRAAAESAQFRAAARPELGAWLGASLTRLPLGLVPSIELGLRLPAALEAPSALPGYAQTLVVGGPAGLEALPLGAGRLPVLTTRLGVRFPASPSLALALFGEYGHDPNRTSLLASPTGTTRSFAAPDSLSVFTAAQARF